MSKENETIEELKTLLSTSEAEKLTLTEELEKAVTQLAAKEAEVETQESELIALNDKLAAIENNPGKKPERAVLTHGKSKYKVMFPKTEIPGIGIITVQDLRANTIKVDGVNLLEYLITLGSGMLKKVKENV